MKFYAVLFVILPAFAFAQPVNAPYQAYVDQTIALLQADAPVTSPTTQEPQEAPKPTCPELTDIKEKTTCYATKHGIDQNLAHTIVSKESQYNPTARGDMKILKNGHGVCSNKKSPLYGKPAEAKGLAQITTCWFPSISKEDADNPDFALTWMMERLAEGEKTCKNLWSTCPL